MSSLFSPHPSLRDPYPHLSSIYSYICRQFLGVALYNVQVSHYCFITPFTLFIYLPHTIQHTQRFSPSWLCMNSLTGQSVPKQGKADVCILNNILKDWMVLRCRGRVANSSTTQSTPAWKEDHLTARKNQTPGNRRSLLNTFVYGWMTIHSRRNMFTLVKGKTLNISSMRIMKATSPHCHHYNQKSLRILSNVISTKSCFKISKVPRQ